MTRRRFFPSSPAQSIPGRTVELEMQLPKAAVQAAGGGQGASDDILGAGWFSPAFCGEYEWAWESQPGGRWFVNSGAGASIWEGIPGGESGGAPTPSSTFRCIELTAPEPNDGPYRHHVGVVQGASMSGVRWDAVWDTPSPSDPTVSAGVGNRFTTWGNVIVVEQINTGGGGIGGMSGTETLTATAYSGAAPVATLVLHCFHPAY